MTTFQDKVKALRAHHEELLSRKNEPVEWGNLSVKTLLNTRHT